VKEFPVSRSRQGNRETLRPLRWAPPLTDFGDELHRLLAERRISLRETARRAECTPGYLSNVAHGRKPLTPSLAARLDRVLATGDKFAAYALNPPPDRNGIGPAHTGLQYVSQPASSVPRPRMAVPAVHSADSHGPGGTGPLSSLRSSGLHADSTELDLDTVLHPLGGIPSASVVPVISALTEILLGYIRADRLMGSVILTGPVRSHVSLIESVCEAARGADRIAALTFASRFMEFCGWVHQDAGDLPCAMRWTDRGLDYALELGDQRIVAYTLMRKAAIATEAGLPGHGLGMTNAALSSMDTLTPRLRAVILRQRAYAQAMLKEPLAAARDADTAIAEAIVGVSQGEDDRAPYCSPMYAAMEAGAVQVRLGNAAAALPILEKSRSTWSDHSQARDYALCLSRLATAYAAAGEREQAYAAADEAMAAARGLASRRATSQLIRLGNILARWGKDPSAAETIRRLNALTRPGIAAP
jgi:tetratricopeptide (TPR) repeat protein